MRIHRGLKAFVVAGAIMARAAAADAADDWLGPDKAAHFGFSVAFSSAATTTVPFAGGPAGDWKTFALGAGIGLVPGIAKECWDATGRGDASWKDFAWDVGGIVVGAGLVWAVQALTGPAAAR